MLQCVGVTGFTTLSRYTSTRIALVGGVFTTLPVLVLLTIPFGLDALFECPTLSLISVIVLIGAVQGCIGALVWKGKVYTVIDGETIPGVLGVGSAMLAGVLGGFLLVLYLHTFVTVRQCFFQKEKPPHGLASPLGMKVAEAENNPR